jgi:hypothetical protein
MNPKGMGKGKVIPSGKIPLGKFSRFSAIADRKAISLCESFSNENPTFTVVNPSQHIGKETVETPE